MAQTFKSWEALEKAIQQEMKNAMEETVDKSFQDLHKNVDHFYDKPGNPTSVAKPPPGYDRTGQLAESPEQKVSGGGNTVNGELKLDTTYRYVPSGEYEFGQHVRIDARSNIFIRVDEDFYI